MKIAITTDHTGLAVGDMYERVKEYIQSLGHEVTDMGPETLDMDDDYPGLMFPAVKAVVAKEFDAAILFGGSGQGEAMAANRIPGARCTVFYAPAIASQPVDAEGSTSDDPYEILRLSRQHNHANVLSLSSRFLNLEEIKQAVKVWLETPYSDAERHVRRVRQLDSF